MSIECNYQAPPEIWSHVYKYVGPNELEALCTTATQTQPLIEAQRILKQRLEAILLRNPWLRSDALYNAAKDHVMENIQFAIAAEELIEVPYLKVRLLCEIGKAWAKKEDIFEAKKKFEKAEEIAEDIDDLMHKIQVFFTIIKAEKEIGDTEGATHTISLAEKSVARLENECIRRQHERILEGMRQG